jgi:hypothetical protein
LTAIVAVMALEHFVDLYIDLVRDQKQKAYMLKRIKIWKEQGKNRTMVEAKWHAMSDNWVLGFRVDVPPFSQLGDLVKLRNRLIHPSQKKLRSRIRGGTPQLIAGIDSEKAAWACKVMKDMVSGFYTLAGRKPPDWLESMMSLKQREGTTHRTTHSQPR